jgi:hypothetical protein
MFFGEIMSKTKRNGHIHINYVKKIHRFVYRKIMSRSDKNTLDIRETMLKNEKNMFVFKDTM